MKNELPSGRVIFNPLVEKEKPSVKETIVEQESVSAMSHDADDQCPKCQGRMMPALAANNVPVFFCDACRVSHPTRE